MARPAPRRDPAWRGRRPHGRPRPRRRRRPVRRRGAGGDQQEHRPLETFLHTLRAQQIPADALAGAGGPRRRRAPVHGAPGQGPRVARWSCRRRAGRAWPDLRRRATLLRADRIGVGGRLVPPTRPRAAWRTSDGCSTSPAPGRCRLVVTAVASTDDEGEQPSRFLAELDPDDDGRPRPPRRGAAGRPLSRRSRGRAAAFVADPSPSRAPARAAAVRCAASPGETARARSGARRRSSTWWGTRAWQPESSPSGPSTSRGGLGQRPHQPARRARPSGSSPRGRGRRAPRRPRGSATSSTCWPTGSPATTGHRRTGAASTC